MRGVTNDNECQPSMLSRLRNGMERSNLQVPFCEESIIHLDGKQSERKGFRGRRGGGVIEYNTYIELCQSEDCEAKDDMKVIVRRAMTTENGWKFKGMNKDANSQL